MKAEISTLLYVSDLVGVAVFAVSGGLMAARHRMDIIGFIVLGIATAVGGGTMRDLLLGLEPVFWIGDPNYLLVAATASATMYFLAPAVQSLMRALVWMDAFGLALFAVVGTGWAIRAEAAFSVTVLMGVLTAVGGGLLRDLIAGEPPLVLRREVYATAALCGAVTYALLHRLDVENEWAMLAGALIAFIVRGLAIRYKLSLPVYGGKV